MSTGALDNVSVPNESTLVAPTPPDSPGQPSPLLLKQPLCCSLAIATATAAVLPTGDSYGVAVFVFLSINSNNRPYWFQSNASLLLLHAKEPGVASSM